MPLLSAFFFFFNDTATTEIYTLSLHDALPICHRCTDSSGDRPPRSSARSTCCSSTRPPASGRTCRPAADRKSTRLNSSHGYISYAVFCLKKKNDHQAPESLLHEITHHQAHRRR